ncbi:unnamed protein product [Larinioides sclopetarius]|uniref:Uncharacterized protein n=1 Tax=Larinioides sclopetarius TaxID=280406 RepID=A0AAV2B6F3_9ARAC
MVGSMVTRYERAFRKFTFLIESSTFYRFQASELSFAVSRRSMVQYEVRETSEASIQHSSKNRNVLQAMKLTLSKDVPVALRKMVGLGI